MTAERLSIGYVPLTDAAAFIVAQELGFAAEEGLDLNLIRLSSWAQSRDLLGAGSIEAAHQLVPMPIAQTLGLGPPLPQVDLLMIVAHGGQAVAVSNDLARRMRADGFGFDFVHAGAAGAALRAASGGRLRVGVPFPFSTQAEVVWHWLAASGFDIRSGAVEVHTVPPPRMAQTLAAGEVDAYCVGEPWASMAVETGAGALLLPARAIWAGAPEKGLVMRRDIAEADPDRTGRLMRALWRAGRWLDQPDNRGTAAELICRPDYLNLQPEVAERGLQGRFLISGQGEARQVPEFISFHEGAATFPWKSVAALFAERMALQHGLDPQAAMRRAMTCFRTDLYRQHLRAAGADLPGASAKIEGALRAPNPVASEKGEMILRPDAFFDGRVFEPPFADS
ncbi:ABC transporter substrate-binding protein [Frigidibacter oleivorans]|uniref:ABC transporter substrate-binding protein n=1 Tax=Frigidibacter oleivorans TaxID=2487129 RepID=UPI000F8C912A|nr:ABC transporter substrate-binding protein [Frigidibacter oleivorans]